MSEANKQTQFELENGSIETKGGAEPAARPDTPPAGVNPDPPREEVLEPNERQTDVFQEQPAQLKAELEKYKDIALRSVADLDNYRKRMAREKDDAIRYANASFLERLIPILDNFELGLQAAKAGGDHSAVLNGMTMVFKQLQEFLVSCGIETIDATGQPFDPKIHEAISQEENAEVEEGIVIRQVRKGYRLKDRLLRPANVVVSKGTRVGEDTAKAGAST